MEDEAGVKVVVTHGAGEEGLIDRVDSLRGRESRGLKGPANLIELAGFIESASAFISGSTGPMHIAAAVGTPTLSFFSPVRSCSPRRWGPVADTRRIIMPPVPECPTCVGSRCAYYDCMDRIDMQAVTEAVRGLLGPPPAE
jgi:heptosyltransferase-3